MISSHLRGSEQYRGTYFADPVFCHHFNDQLIANTIDISMSKSYCKSILHIILCL